MTSTNAVIACESEVQVAPGGGLVSVARSKRDIHMHTFTGCTWSPGFTPGWREWSAGIKLERIEFREQIAHPSVSGRGVWLCGGGFAACSVSLHA
jgi:hypothetical protein